jgi:hypothetical protein
LLLNDSRLYLLAVRLLDNGLLDFNDSCASTAALRGDLTWRIDLVLGTGLTLADGSSAASCNLIRKISCNIVALTSCWTLTIGTRSRS